MQNYLKFLMASFVAAALMGMPAARAGEEKTPSQFVLLVELDIDPAQLDAYKADERGDRRLYYGARRPQLECGRGERQSNSHPFLRSL
jgi:hypothetical protein